LSWALYLPPLLQASLWSNSNIPLQARDFIAILRRRDGGASADISLLLQYAYVVLTFKQDGRTKDYGESLLLWHLQIQYLRSVGHPMLSVYQDDLQICNEDLGEVSLSEFSKGVGTSSAALDFETMSRAYQLQGVRRQSFSRLQAAAGVSNTECFHEVTSTAKKVEIERAAAVLDQIRKDAHYRNLGLNVWPQTGTLLSGYIVAVGDPGKRVFTYDAMLATDSVLDVANDMRRLQDLYLNKDYKTADDLPVASESSSSEEEEGRLLAPMQLRSHKRRTPAGAKRQSKRKRNADSDFEL
jgi:hypothetical protein